MTPASRTRLACLTLLFLVGCGPDPRLELVGSWIGDEVVTFLTKPGTVAFADVTFVVTIDPDDDRAVNVVGNCTTTVDVDLSGAGKLRPLVCPPRSVNSTCSIVDAITGGDVRVTDDRISMTDLGTMTASSGCNLSPTQQQYRRQFAGRRKQ